jgi:hypothetical protein
MAFRHCRSNRCLLEIVLIERHLHFEVEFSFDAGAILHHADKPPSQVVGQERHRYGLAHDLQSHAVAGKGCSVQINKGWLPSLRVLKLTSACSHRRHIDGQILRFAVQGEFEVIGQRLEHPE